MTMDDVFTVQEVNEIIRVGSSCKLTESTYEHNSADALDSDIRQSLTAFIHPTEESSWIFDKLFNTVHFMNERYFQYELFGFSTIQYTEYGPSGDHYSWHVDLEQNRQNLNMDTTKWCRKLSASVILSDTSDYEGGEFDIQRDPKGNPLFTVEQQRGSVIFFPSYAEHRVRPVTKGTRRSLVVWVLGPKFK